MKIWLRGLVWLWLLTLLSACLGGPPAQSGSNSAPGAAVSGSAGPGPASPIVQTARRLLGAPYRYGGASPQGFDCSGLVYYVFQRNGIRVPRTSLEQYRQAARVPLAQLQPGDLLFFRLHPAKISHVAIYERQGRFIHAPSSGKRVAYASLQNSYWRKHLVGVGRY